MRQPPENSEQGRCLIGRGEAEAGEDLGGARRRRMRADVGEPRLDVGDAVRVLRGLGFRQQADALLVGPQHDVDQAVGAVGRFLRQAADAAARRELHRAVLGR